MLLRGRAFPLTTYRRRRQRAAALIEQQADAPLPLLLCGYTLDDEANVPNPLLGRMRQDPWFDYYCGCHEANAALLIEGRRSTLFLDPGDPARVVWEGVRLAPNREARRAFGVTQVAALRELKTRVGEAAAAAGDRLAMCHRKREPGIQARAVERWRRRLRGIQIVNAEPWLVAQRMIKEPDEVRRIRRAIALTRTALLDTLSALPRLDSESAVGGALVQHYLGAANESPAFTPIVASGVNGATLHYPHNDRPLRRNIPLLIDSGARCDGYCADVTRCVPRLGRFDHRRYRAIYDLVLAANARGRQHARPGITLTELNDIAWRPIIEAGFEKRHGLSHHIGLDVHDPADYEAPLAPGMVISNEPGIYLPDEGFGIRIEDDLLITARGCEELTRRIPKQPADLTALIRG